MNAGKKGDPKMNRGYKEIRAEEVRSEPNLSSPLDIMRRMGGQAHPVRNPSGKQADSMLAAYKDRMTYTFIMEGEVASIHFDRVRGEIFFRGHSIKNMELSEAQVLALHSLVEILKGDEEGKSFYADYEATLSRLMADK